MVKEKINILSYLILSNTTLFDVPAFRTTLAGGIDSLESILLQIRALHCTVNVRTLSYLRSMDN
jgi:hypothetical protein